MADKASSKGTRTQQLQSLRERYVPRGIHTGLPAFVESGSGVVIRDVEGREYLDFAGGIGVLAVGHTPQEIVQAVTDQMHELLHMSAHVMMYEGYVRLAQRMSEIAPGSFPKKTMFANSGAEAIENAVKIARYYRGQPGLIAFDNSFHGRTYLALSLTGKVKPYRIGFGPMAPSVFHTPYPYCYRCLYNLSPENCGLACLESLRDLFKLEVAAEEVAAIVVEPVQGEGGFIVPPIDFMQGLRDMARELGIVLVVDEVQTGFGRTGRMFASEHFGLEPDLMTTAKSLAAGLPLSAVTGRAEIMDAPHPGGMGTTFGGNPVACAAALAVLEKFQRDKLVERAQKVGQKLRARLESFRDKYPLVGDVRGLGAMVGMELVKDRQTREPATEEAARVISGCFEHGLIVLKAGLYENVVRVLLPLVVEDEQLERGLDILEDSLKTAQGS